MQSHRGTKSICQLIVPYITEYYTEVHLHCFLRKLYSSLSKYRKQKQSPPGCAPFLVFSEG
jgi:hypothetical protein